MKIARQLSAWFIVLVLAAVMVVGTQKTARAQSPESVQCYSNGDGSFTCSYPPTVTTCYVIMLPCYALESVTVQGGGDVWNWFAAMLYYMFGYYWFL